MGGPSHATGVSVSAQSAVGGASGIVGTRFGPRCCLDITGGVPSRTRCGLWARRLRTKSSAFASSCLLVGLIMTSPCHPRQLNGLSACAKAPRIPKNKTMTNKPPTTTAMFSAVTFSGKDCVCWGYTLGGAANFVPLFVGRDGAGITAGERAAESALVGRSDVNSDP